MATPSERLRAIAVEATELAAILSTPEPPPPPPPPAPQTSRVLFGATYSSPTLPAVHGYKVQVVPFFGWGSTEANLDARISEMQGAEYRVLTACNAPAHYRPPMTPGDPWAGLNDRIKPDQHQAYANLIGLTVKRNNLPGMRRRVTHVQVWNEGKGYWNSAANRWNYEEETDLYLKVHAAVKAADPDVLVGGPYPAFTKWMPGTGSNKAADASLSGPWGEADQRDFDWLNYFFDKARDRYDFVTVDANLGCRPYVLKAGSSTQWVLQDPPGTPQQAAMWFMQVAKWIRARTAKPIWWAECYPYCKGSVLWQLVADSLKAVPGEHVLLWWAEAPYPAPPL